MIPLPDGEPDDAPTVTLTVSELWALFLAELVADYTTAKAWAAYSEPDVQRGIDAAHWLINELYDGL
jgi:hypothetical protein